MALLLQLEHGNRTNIHANRVAVAFAVIDYHTNHDSTPLKVERVRRHKLISSWLMQSLVGKSR